MKKINLILLIAALLVFGSGIAAFAQTDNHTQAITISASLDHGVSLPASSTIRNCPGTIAANQNPFLAPCVAATNISFGTLAHVFRTNGQPDPSKQAGCFYAENFFMVFLYPAVWGGTGFELSQTFSWSGDALPLDAVVMTPVYRPEDRWIPTDATSAQGAQPSLTDLKAAGPALTASTIYRDPRTTGLARAEGRIIRAVYSIPPNPGVGQTKPYADWKALPLTTPWGDYTGNVVITITELQ